ncbi:MAG TPA: alpha/beta fold hydrolase [Gemmatimonadales bacterium]|nr:alpha/beta fold hydrolase [Gemmatimonadales bacterium]
MSKSAVLFIHGFPFDHSMWRHQLEALAAWKCVAPDLRGAGVSDAPAEPQAYSMAAYARDLTALLDKQRIESVVLCGLSMGGYIAFELLRQIPERVRAAILCNTKSAADTPEAKWGRDVLTEKARALGARAVAEELIPKVLGRETRERQPQVVREVTQMMERQPVAGIVGALRALRERPDSTSLLGTIRVPVLVIAGDDDQITPAAGMQEMARAIPDARFVLIAGAGHLTPLEQSAKVSSALEVFLTTLG